MKYEKSNKANREVKYILLVDWMTQYMNDYTVVELNAKTLADAILEVEAGKFNAGTNENVYLARIHERDGKQTGKDWKAQEYKAMCTRRTHAWYTEGESDTRIRRDFHKEFGVVYDWA